MRIEQKVRALHAESARLSQQAENRASFDSFRFVERQKEIVILVKKLESIYRNAL